MMRRAVSIAGVIMRLAIAWAVVMYAAHTIKKNDDIIASSVVRNDSQDMDIKEIQWRINAQGMFLRSHLDTKHQHDMDKYFRKHKQEEK